MSFFDETDEPRPAPRRRRPAGAGRRPPTDQQAIIVRRAVAGVAILVVVILMVIGIHSCQVSSRNSALKSYNTSVGSLIQQSDNNVGKPLFSLLLAGGLANHELSAQTQLDAINRTAQSQLQQGRSLSAPDQVTTAQQNFVVGLSLRADGVADIANRIQQALNKSTAEDAVTSIAVDMQEFLASDVVYTTQTAREIAAALHAAGIPVGGPSGETIEATSFLPNLAWLTPSYIAKALGASLPAANGGGTACPTGDTCGHVLNNVSVGGVQLSTGGGNTIPASPSPTFTVNFTNGGSITESGVTVQVTVTTSSGTTISAQTVVPSTKAGQTYTPQITLPKVPPTGQASVQVTVEKVPGETNLNNNTLTFPVTFD